MASKIDRKFSGPEVTERLAQLSNAANQQLLSIDAPEEIGVNIRPNKDVAPGKFKPDPFLPGGYIANETTIRAMRKEIFMAGEDFIDLELKVRCEGCDREIDLQFWHFCPFCERQFSNNI